MSTAQRLRCAVYTRKSSEEGLDQEFNSLDAQREACAAFIASQVGLGWKLHPDRYDDGGISGGTMERPALQRLLQDIRDRKIDVVVVYKIDRLTRSLTDFAKIVDVFDGSGISFVSVTQQFNTTTSMGRLTLNVLLSFAQFEREVTAERIRDKIAASKRKGMWMGGTVPLGYRVEQRKLLIKEPEASFVRSLFSRYLELCSVPALADKVTRDADATADDASDAAMEPGPARFTRRVGSGMLYKLLSNPIYIGKLRHRENVYDGEHDAIIDLDQFDQVQRLLASQAATPRGSSTHSDTHLLTGLLYDDTGDRMNPTHATARGKRFRYYVSSRIKGARQTDSTAWRIPASTVDGAIVRFAIGLFSDHVRLSGWIRAHAPSARVEAAIGRSASITTMLTNGTRAGQREILQQIVSRITLGAERITIKVDAAAVIRLLTISPSEAGSVDGQQVAPLGPQVGQALPSTMLSDHEYPDTTIEISLPITLKRRGNEMRLVIDGEIGGDGVDSNLVAMVAKAHVYLEKMIENPNLGSSGVASLFGVDRADVGRVLPLAFMAPRLLDQILTGRQSEKVSARNLARQELPVLWSEQITALS